MKAEIPVFLIVVSLCPEPITVPNMCYVPINYLPNEYQYRKNFIYIMEWVTSTPQQIILGVGSTLSQIVQMFSKQGLNGAMEKIN